MPNAQDQWVLTLHFKEACDADTGNCSYQAKGDGEATRILNPVQPGTPKCAGTPKSTDPANQGRNDRQHRICCSSCWFMSSLVIDMRVLRPKAARGSRQNAS